VVLLGAGGHGRVVLAAARTMSDVEIVGFLDPIATGDVDGAPVLGKDDALSALAGRGVTHAVVTVGSVRPSPRRAELFARIRAAGLLAATIVHGSAIVAAGVLVGEGSVVVAGAIVNPGARIGRNCIVNTSAVIEHDCDIADHVHVSPGATLGGGVKVSQGAHVGIGATVLQRVHIGSMALVGAGAVVIDDVSEGSVVVGVPARPIRSD